jgi:hypothetical protein
VLGRLRQENHEFKGSLDYPARHCLKNNFFFKNESRYPKFYSVLFALLQCVALTVLPRKRCLLVAIISLSKEVR